MHDTVANENLLNTCEAARDHVDAFLQSINEYVAVVEGLPAIAKPLVKRDIKTNTGMSAEEWKAFLERLNARYETIREAAKRVADALAKKDETEVAAGTAALKEVWAPFPDGIDTAIKELEKMVTYMEGMPAKINMVPDGFLKAEVKTELIAAVPGRIKRARALKELLERTKGEISAATG
jgi:hypothetical protein